MMTKLTRTTYIAANVLGLLLYAVLVARIHQQMQGEHRQSADFGDSMTFALTAFPVLVVFAAANVSWGIWAMVRFTRYRECQALVLGGLMVIIWTATVLIVRQLP
jgi:heme/copper-type cytochrome/quinol oxidase subunit 2